MATSGQFYWPLVGSLAWPLTFVIVAAFLYFFIVVPMNRIIARRRRNETVDQTQPSMPEDIALLQEIRDLLKLQGRTTRQD